MRGGRTEAPVACNPVCYALDVVVLEKWAVDNGNRTVFVHFVSEDDEGSEEKRE